MLYRPQERKSYWKESFPSCCYGGKKTSDSYHRSKPTSNCGETKKENVLLQKIVACERRHIPCAYHSLELEDVPSCAKPPFKLLDVRQNGAQPWWRAMDCPGDYKRIQIKIFIPVCAELQDSCGKTFFSSGVVETEASVKAGGNVCDSWKQQFFIIPCVALLQGEYCSETPVFCVKLEIKLEIYLLRPEACALKKSEPPCPDLPVYPHFHHEPCQPWNDWDCRPSKWKN